MMRLITATCKFICTGVTDVNRIGAFCACMFFALDFQWISVSSAGKLIVRGVALTVLSRKTTSCVFDRVRSVGHRARARRLSTNMELGSELEAHNPLESFHQL